MEAPYGARTVSTVPHSSIINIKSVAAPRNVQKKRVTPMQDTEESNSEMERQREKGGNKRAKPMEVEEKNPQRDPQAGLQAESHEETAAEEGGAEGDSEDEVVPVCTSWRMPKEKDPTGPINYNEKSDIVSTPSKPAPAITW